MNLPEALLAIASVLPKENKGKVPLKITGKKKPSNGQLFKTKHGISKTLKRNMTRRNLDPFNPLDVIKYKEARKERKRIMLKEEQKKHNASTLYKRLNSKKKTKGNPSGKQKKASDTPKKTK